MSEMLEKEIRLIEIYASVQGESSWAGEPCVFIRTARCNLRCVWCDTTYSFGGGEKWTLGAVMVEVERLGIHLVEITGGEPLLQSETTDLCNLLLERGHTVLVETGGSLPIDVLPAAAIKIMDLKCPDSGECEKNHWANLATLNPAQDELKFVIASRRDYEWARDAVCAHSLREKCRHILFSPVFDMIEPKAIVEWMLEDKVPARFQLQMHKFIWPPNQKGV